MTIIEGVEVDNFQSFVDNKGIIFVCRCVAFEHAPDFICRCILESCIRSYVSLGPIERST